MIIIRNNPTLSKAFREPEVKEFFKNFLEKLSDPYILKDFLKEGFEQLYNDQIEQLSKSFVVTVKSEVGFQTYEEVIRCIDGVFFKVGETVFDKVEQRNLPIGRMYEDERGLHVRLDVDDKGTITWRDLGRIEKIG